MASVRIVNIQRINLSIRPILSDRRADRIISLSLFFFIFFLLFGGTTVKPIKFSQDIKVSVQANHVNLTSTIDHPHSVNQHTTVIDPIQIYTQLDINSKEFWELVKRAAVELRLNTPSIIQQELSMIIADAAITIQNTMDQ